MGFRAVFVVVVGQAPVPAQHYTGRHTGLPLHGICPYVIIEV